MDSPERIKERRKKMGTRGPKPGEGGRPSKIDIDLKAFETIIQLPLDTDTICNAIGVHRTTLDRFCRSNYGKTFAQLQSENRGLFSRNIVGKQYQLAMQGNTKMLELLGANYCGQSKKVENTVTAQVTGDVTYVTAWGGLSEPSDES